MPRYISLAPYRSCVLWMFFLTCILYVKPSIGTIHEKNGLLEQFDICHSFTRIHSLYTEWGMQILIGVLELSSVCEKKGKRSVRFDLLHTCHSANKYYLCWNEDLKQTDGKQSVRDNLLWYSRSLPYFLFFMKIYLVVLLINFFSCFFLCLHGKYKKRVGRSWLFSSVFDIRKITY